MAQQSAGVMSPEEAEIARDAANAYKHNMPKHRAQVMSMLKVAFHPNTNEGESAAAFGRARKLMAKMEVSIEDIVRADWGGGPLVAALQKVGYVKFTSGKYKNHTMAEVIEADPSYIVKLHKDKTWRPGTVCDAIDTMYHAWMSELVCRFTGEMDGFDIRDWDG